MKSVFTEIEHMRYEMANTTMLQQASDRNGSRQSGIEAVDIPVVEQRQHPMVQKYPDMRSEQSRS